MTANCRRAEFKLNQRKSSWNVYSTCKSFKKVIKIHGKWPFNNPSTNWRQFFMRLSCYWSWFSSYHYQSSCGSADYFDNDMTKFIVYNRTNASKTDINLFFTITNCQIVRSRFLTHRRHELQIHVSVRMLTIKISLSARENSCNYRKKIPSSETSACGFARELHC